MQSWILRPRNEDDLASADIPFSLSGVWQTLQLLSFQFTWPERGLILYQKRVSSSNFVFNFALTIHAGKPAPCDINVADPT